MAEHLLSLADHPAERLSWLLGVAAEVKEAPARYADALRGRFLGMIFSEPSALTHISFAAGISQLGGSSLPAYEGELQFGDAQALGDTARCLSGYLDGVVAGVSDQADLERLAAASSIPLINGRSGLLNPCQAFADFFTLREAFGGTLEGVRLAYLGAGNNVCHSLLLGGAKLGVSVAVATPEGQTPQPSIVEKAQQMAIQRGCRIELGTDPVAAVTDADAVYTTAIPADISSAERNTFESFRVDAELLAHATADARFLHCLPARRGEEVTGEVFDGSASLVWQQSENRLHVQKALMLFLMDAM